MRTEISTRSLQQLSPQLAKRDAEEVFQEVKNKQAVLHQAVGPKATEELGL